MISTSNQAAFVESHKDLERQTERINAIRYSNVLNREYFSCNTAVFASNMVVMTSNNMASFNRSTMAFETDSVSRVTSAMNSAIWSSNVLSEWMLACAFMGKLYGSADADVTSPQKSGSTILTTDVHGNGMIYFDVPFPNSYTTSVVCNGDPTMTASGVFANSNSGKSFLGISLFPIRGCVNVKVNWVATGT